MEAHGDGAVPAHVPSITHIIRMHNEAVTAKIGNERVEHLEHVANMLSSFMQEAACNTLIDSEAKESAMSLQQQVAKDLQAARANAGACMPEDDGHL